MLNYHQLFDGRLLLINGPARSGTSLLGRILGSCLNTFYLYEPALLQYPTFMPRGSFLMVLFEDYFLPLMTARHRNVNQLEDTDWVYYFDEPRLHGARRQTVLQYIHDTSPTFIIKLTDIMHLRLSHINYLTGLPKSCIIARNGYDVISSSVKKGWYTDAWMGDAIIDFWTTTLPASDQWMWLPNTASPATRASCLWRNFITTFPTPDITYESLVADPESAITDLLSSLSLTPTSLTDLHVQSVKRHSPTPHDHQAITNLITPDHGERDKFLSALSLYHANRNYG